MKEHNIKKLNSRSGISLIETLISLAIVSVALVALLPVITLKTSSNLDKGNSLWGFQDGQNYYQQLPTNSLIGVPTADDPTTRLLGQNQQLQDIARPFLTDSLGITSRLNFRGTEYRIPGAAANQAGLTLTAGQMVTVRNFVPAAGGAAQIDARRAFPQQIFYDSTANQNRLITENNTSTDWNDGVWNYVNSCAFNNSLNYIFDFDSSTYGLPRRSTAGANQNYYVISQGSDNCFGGFEKIAVDTEHNVIGIGQNASVQTLRHSDSAGADTTQDFIGIYNDAVITPGQINQDAKLAIGANTANPDMQNNSTDFVIYQGSAATDLILNAATTQASGLTASAIIFPSDARLKNVIAESKKGLKEILKIHPVEFTFKKDKTQKHHIGVIAQELQKIFPESVRLDKVSGYLNITTDHIFYALLNAIKELYAKNIELEKSNDELAEKIVKLRKIRDELKASEGGANE